MRYALLIDDRQGPRHGLLVEAETHAEARGQALEILRDQESVWVHSGGGISIQGLPQPAAELQGATP